MREFHRINKTQYILFASKPIRENSYLYSNLFELQPQRPIRTPGSEITAYHEDRSSMRTAYLACIVDC